MKFVQTQLGNKSSYLIVKVVAYCEKESFVSFIELPEAILKVRVTVQNGSKLSSKIVATALYNAHSSVHPSGLPGSDPVILGCTQ